MPDNKQPEIINREPTWWEKIRAYVDPNDVFDPVNYPDKNSFADLIPGVSNIRSYQRLDAGIPQQEYNDAIKEGGIGQQLLTALGYSGDLANLIFPVGGALVGAEKKLAQRAIKQGLSPEAGIFGGIKAKNAPLDDLAKAKTAIEAGADAKQVWKETGWYQAPWDKQWRFEIPDNSIRVYSKDQNITLKDTVSHNKLFEQYPHDEVAKKLAYYDDPRSSERGSWNPIMEKILINKGKAKNIDELKSSTVHELQHAIQDKEKFTSGGNITQFYDVIRKERNVLDRQIDDINKQLSDASNKGDRALYYKLLDDRQKIVDQYQAMGGNDPVWLSEEPFKRYQRIPGEAEARLVQKRMGYTPQQRRDIFPLDDLDVPLEELLIEVLK